MLGHRIFILPTRFGLLYGLLLLLMWLGAVNYANSMGYVLTFLLASIAVVSILHAYRNLLGLEVVGGPHREQFADRPLAVSVVLSEREGRARIGIVVAGEGTCAVRVDVAARATASATLIYPSVCRGRFEPRWWTISTEFPLGLFRAWAWVGAGSVYLVYPAPAVDQVPLPSGPSFCGNGGERGRVGADDFIGLRPYRAGDSPKHVHWKTLARSGTLATKQFGGDHTTAIWLDWSHVGTEHLEEGISRLCRWVLEAAEGSLCYGLRMPGCEIAQGSGEAHRRRCLERLAVWQG